MFVSRNVNHVYAVEPVTTDILRKNIALNKTVQNPPMEFLKDNITVLDICISNNKEETIEWLGNKKTVSGYTLTQLINICGGKVDFIKTDCEGGEWCIKPEELKNIRRFEGEIHSFNGRNAIDFLKILDEAGFKYEHVLLPDSNMIVHAWK